MQGISSLKFFRFIVYLHLHYVHFVILLSHLCQVSSCAPQHQGIYHPPNHTSSISKTSYFIIQDWGAFRSRFTILVWGFKVLRPNSPHQLGRLFDAMQLNRVSLVIFHVIWSLCLYTLLPIWVCRSQPLSP